MKKISVPIILTIFTLTIFSVSPASAGSTQRHRWEGVAIGVGAAIIGGAILDSMINPRHYAYESDYRPSHHQYYPPPHDRGHWEIRRHYIPPTYERVWNPPHYDRHGRWVNGQWIDIEREPGRWVEEKVWVSHR